MDSHQALYDFIVHNKIKTDSVGNCKFYAAVNYKSPLKNIVTQTEVKFIRSGYNDGAVTLGEQPEMQAEDYHLDLTTKWQSYSFQKNSGTLTIKGTSPKMGGSYVLQINSS